MSTATTRRGSADVGWDRDLDLAEERRAALSRISTLRTEARIPGMVAVLEDAGISVIVLKGPVTRRRLYGPHETRPTVDVDLLVPPGSFRRARTVLAAGGYSRFDSGGHSDTLIGPGGAIDLHLALPYSEVAPSRGFEILSEHTTTLRIAGCQIPVLDEPAHGVHLALHAAQNRFRPTHRSLDEWARARASLSRRERVIAERLAGRIGAGQTFALAHTALDHPDAAPDLVPRLPIRKPTPSALALLAFATSPIPRLVKARAAAAFVRRQLSDDVLDTWRARRGLVPVASGAPSIWVAKAHRLAVVTASGIGASR